MRRIFAFGATAALILGLSACNKQTPDVVVPADEQGNTYMSLRIATAADVQTRLEDGAPSEGSTNKVGDWEGNDAFESVDIYMITAGVGEVQYRQQAGNTLTPPTTTDDARYQQTPSWKTTAGTKTVYVVLNASDEVLEALNNAAANATTFDAEYKKAYAMFNGTPADAATPKYWKKDAAGKEVVMMSATPVVVTIAEGVTAEEAYGHNTNNVEVTARRVETRAVVTMDQAVKSQENTGIVLKYVIHNGTAVGNGDKNEQINYETKEGEEFGKLKDVKWTVAQYEKTLYLHPLTELINGRPYPVTTAKQIKTPGYDYVPENQDDYYGANTKAMQLYDYSQLKSESAIEVTGITRNGSQSTDYASVADIVSKTTKSLVETTHKWGLNRHDKNVADADKSGYVRGNTPYVQVTAIFTPADGAWKPGEKAKYQTGGNLYFGTVTGLFYADLALAQADNKGNAEKLAPGVTFDPEVHKDGVVTYKGGKVFYFAYLNPDSKEAAKVINVPVLRNNIYHVNISKFTEIGASGNSRNPNPENPEKPDPDDPKKEDPTNPVAKTDTYMVTTVTVLNWGVHSNNVEF